MAGTVSKLSVEKGERVVGTIQMTGTELLRIADMNKMEVLVDVNENDIVRVSLNDTAIIEMDAYFGKKFKGIITEIANSSKNTNQSNSSDQVTNFEVKILILKSSYKSLISEEKNVKFPFRPGMTATADIQTETRNDVISVPILAVTTRLDTASHKTIIEEENVSKKNIKKENKEPDEIVFIYNEDGTVKKAIVKTGLQDNDFIEILSGITENDEIVSGPYSAISKRLKDGDLVIKTDKDMLFSKE